ncbi:MAG: hypothetical protein RBG13Loki_4365 [Promethearchaeota archaeon CR_4]|nr:MAG: hypothetical protein RBG13Loki_4365 [Candidatus Lokiarchaeota archaeon CR_4]
MQPMMYISLIKITTGFKSLVQLGFFFINGECQGVKAGIFPDQAVSQLIVLAMYMLQTRATTVYKSLTKWVRLSINGRVSITPLVYPSIRVAKFMLF